MRITFAGLPSAKCADVCKRAIGERGNCKCICSGKNHGMYKRRQQPMFDFDNEPIDWKLK